MATADELVADELAGMYNNNTLFIAVEMFTNIPFIIFTSTMLAAFIVGSFKDRTTALMFMYPIK